MEGKIQEMILILHDVNQKAESLINTRIALELCHLIEGPPMRTKVCYAVTAVILMLLLIVARGAYDTRGASEVVRHSKLLLERIHILPRQKVSECSPYAEMRWRKSTPEIELKGAWYELVSLDDLLTHNIVRFCKIKYGSTWRKRFEEDLVIVLMDMGKQGHFDGDSGSLTARRLDTGEIVTFNSIVWTDANRQSILIKALEAWKANGRKDPRDDIPE